MTIMLNPVCSNHCSCQAASGGKLFIFGGFSTCGGVNVDPDGDGYGWAKVDSVTGEIDTDFSVTVDFDSFVSSMSYDPDSDILYVGGTFSFVGGLARGAVCALDGTTGALLSWAPQITDGGFSGQVYDCKFHNGVLYVVGTFDDIDGTARDCGAGIRADGTLTSWNPGAFSHVIVVLGFDPVTEFFYIDNGATPNYVQCYDTIGAGGIQTFPVTMNDIPTFIPPIGDDGVVYMTSRFSTLNATARDNGGAVTVSPGGVLQPWDPKPNGFEPFIDGWQNIFTTNDNIYACGSFTTVDAGTARNGWASWTKAGALRAWDPGTNGANGTVYVFNDSVYVSGPFTTVLGGTAQSYAAAFDESGSLLSWNPQIDAAIDRFEPAQ